MAGLGDTLAKGAGTAVNILDVIQGLRSGTLGQTMMQRQLATQDPTFRDAIAGSPFMAGLLGLGGERQPMPVDMPQVGGLPSPSAPDRTMQFRANLPPLGEAGQLAQATRRIGLAKTQAQVPLFEAQARNLNTLSDLTDKSMGGTTPLALRQIGPTGATFAPPTGIDVTAGDVGPLGAFGPSAVGTMLPGNRVISSVKADRGGKRLGQSLDRQIKSLDSAVIAYRELFGDRPNKTSAFDVLSQDPSGLEPQLANVPGVGAFTRGGSFGLPGRPSVAVLANQGNADARNIISGGGLRAIIARMTGEVGNLNENEQKVVADAFLPLPTDTKASAIQKRETFFHVSQAIREGLASGQLTPETAHDVILQAATGESGGSVPTTTGIAPTTTQPSPFSPAELEQHRANVFGPPVRQLRRAGTR